MSYLALLNNMDTYNRQGVKIDSEEFSMLFENEKYRIIARNEIEDLCVSTVWLGINHGDDENILIFETMVFDKDHNSISFYDPCVGEYDEDEKIYCIRYSTEEMAIRGHKSIVRRFKYGR